MAKPRDSAGRALGEVSAATLELSRLAAELSNEGIDLSCELPQLFAQLLRGVHANSLQNKCSAVKVKFTD